MGEKNIPLLRRRAIKRIPLHYGVWVDIPIWTDNRVTQVFLASFRDHPPTYPT